MRTLLSLICALLLLVSVGVAGVPIFYEEVSVTDTSSTVTIDLDVTADKAFSIIVTNDGANEIFVNFNGSPALTTHPKLLTGETLNVKASGGFSITTISIIASTGETATARVFAFPTVE